MFEPPFLELCGFNHIVSHPKDYDPHFIKTVRVAPFQNKWIPNTDFFYRFLSISKYHHSGTADHMVMLSLLEFGQISFLQSYIDIQTNVFVKFTSLSSEDSKTGISTNNTNSISFTITVLFL